MTLSLLASTERPDRRAPLALAALVPAAWLVSDHRLPWLTAWSDAWALALIALTAALAPRGGRVAAGWPLLMVLLAASVLVQWALGLVPFAGDAWITILYLAGFALALHTGAALAARDDTAREQAQTWIAAGLVAAALASSFIALLQWSGNNDRLGLWGVPFPPGARPFGNVAQPNHLCTIAFLGLAGTVMLFEQRRLGGVATALMAAVLLVGMALSGSRTGWLQLGLAAVLWLAWLRPRAPRLSTAAVALALGGYAALVLALPALTDALQLGGVRSLDDQARAGPRLLAWRIFADAVTHEPGWGWGWHHVARAQAAVALDHPPLGYHFEHAHNVLLDLALWLGLPLALLACALALWALAQAVARARTGADRAALVGVAGVLVHGLLEFPLEYAYFLVPLGLLLGAQPQAGAAAGPRARAWPLRTAGATMAVALLVTGIDYLEAESNHRTLRFESARIGQAQADSAPPELRVLTQLEAFLTFARTPPRPGLTPAEIAFSRRVSERFAYPSAQFRHAQVLALNGDPAGAARLLQVLCRMHPRPRCEEAIAGWTALQAQQAEHQGEYRAVPAPTLPR